MAKKIKKEKKDHFKELDKPSKKAEFWAYRNIKENIRAYIEFQIEKHNPGVYNFD